MSDRPWIVVVGLPPGEPDSREMLELVLAGATLDVELAVVFADAGCAHLEPEAFAPWRQLVDFELARLFARRPDSELLPGGVELIDDAGFASMCGNAAGVLTL